jgi:hypothetical protein
MICFVLSPTLPDFDIDSLEHDFGVTHLAMTNGKAIPKSWHGEQKDVDPYQVVCGMCRLDKGMNVVVVLL